jgi:hypothetical protein
MDKAEMQNNKNERSDQAAKIGTVVILGVAGYILLFGFVMLVFAVSGSDAWYSIYAPLIAIPGILLGPLVFLLRSKSKSGSLK